MLMNKVRTKYFFNRFFCGKVLRWRRLRPVTNERIERTRRQVFFRSNPLESHKTAKEKFGNIWKKLGGGVVASLNRKGFLEREIWPSGIFRAIQGFSKFYRGRCASLTAASDAK